MPDNVSIELAICLLKCLVGVINQQNLKNQSYAKGILTPKSQPVLYKIPMVLQSISNSTYQVH